MISNRARINSDGEAVYEGYFGDYRVRTLNYRDPGQVQG